jgi:D-serine deaminase-like pyridoxal phosphate-dependent protein
MRMNAYTTVVLDRSPDATRAGQILDALGACDADLLTPALILDLDTVAANIAALRRAFGDRWRPHVKTVKQRVVLELLLDAGVRSFKCATLRELATILDTAKIRACEHELDVLVAYPLRGPALRGFLAARDRSTARLTTLADDPAHLTTLLEQLPPAAILLDLDVGMGRTGTTMTQWAAAPELASPITFAALAGLHAYEGHVRPTADGDLEGDELGALYRALGHFAATRLRRPEQVLVTSGTPAGTTAAADPHLARGPFRHQISPGTLVLSDLRSAGVATALGVRPAAFVATRVVHRGEVRCTLDAGSKALGADGPGPHAALFPDRAVEVATPSEEHLPLRADDPHVLPSAGELVLLIPAHVCTTVNLHERALWYAGGRLVGEGPIDARGHDVWLPRPREAAG